MKGNEIRLAKRSSSEELKRYFATILDLSNVGEEFPVDLDDVWMLAYSQKRDAVRLLQGGQFIQDVDFTACQNGKVININDLANGVKSEIKISVPCLEYLIARKVRSVFEVYRQVFHGVTKGAFQIPQTFSEALMLAARQQKRIEEQTRQLEVAKPKAEYFDNLVDRGLNVCFRDAAKEIGVKQNTFIKYLLEKKYVYRNKKGALRPYSPYNNDLFVVKDAKSDTNKWSGTQTLITPKGKETFRLLLNN